LQYLQHSLKPCELADALLFLRALYLVRCEVTYEYDAPMNCPTFALPLGFHHLHTPPTIFVMQIFREGFKNSTWWEDEYEAEASHEWRL